MSTPEKMQIAYLVEALNDYASRPKPTPGRHIMGEAADALQALGEAVDSLGDRLAAYQSLEPDPMHTINELRSRLDSAAKVCAERHTDTAVLAATENELSAVCSENKLLRSRLDQITAMVRATTMSPMDRLSAVERVCGVETTYPPDHLKRDVHGDCMCAVCKPLVVENHAHKLVDPSNEVVEADEWRLCVECGYLQKPASE